jgi:hypothetical protein
LVGLLMVIIAFAVSPGSAKISSKNRIYETT